MLDPDFSNTLTKSSIERLASSDEFESVREVQEFFADYSPLTSSHFSLSLLPTPLSIPPPGVSPRSVISLYGDSPNKWDSISGGNDGNSLERHVQGIVALCLSLKKKPVIRWEKMSGMAKRLGEEVLVGVDDLSMLSIPQFNDRLR
jgi:vacuolar protein sorting-associated protein 45